MAIQYFFYKNIRRSIIQFLKMFSNINIERYDVNGNVKGQYLVPIRYGPKAKSYLWVKDHGRDEEMLPMMTAYLTGLDFDSVRLSNKYQNITLEKNGLIGVYAKNVIPYNIGISVNIWALHMVDIDQIYEQMLPYFAPHAYIRVRIPELDIAYDVKVILNGCSPIMTEDVGEEDARVIKWDTTFTIQTWLFKPVDPDGIGLIGKIDGVTSQNNTYSWTSGSGTSGMMGTTGGIVTRYYNDYDTFIERDIPIEDISVDKRPLEISTINPLYVEDDNKILLDYEIFNNR